MKYMLMVGIALAFLGALVVYVQRNATQSGNQRRRAYKSRRLMTPNEAEFFDRMIKALPEHYIFPQVAMSAVIEAASEDRRLAHSDRLSIAQQRIDYVVYSKDHQLVTVVELDDKTHSPFKDKERDNRLMQANMSICSDTATYLHCSPATFLHPKLTTNLHPNPASNFSDQIFTATYALWPRSIVLDPRPGPTNPHV